jgi:hypothetical protein
LLEKQALRQKEEEALMKKKAVLRQGGGYGSGEGSNSRR